MNVLYNDFTSGKGEGIVINYYECIQNSIDYIEDNLKIDIKMEHIASKANFSMYYFFRLFNDMVGESVKEYIRKRRLSQAAIDIIKTDKRIIDIALDYGFESQESFTRAFQKLHGITPGKCRKYKNHISIYEKINVRDVSKSGAMMEYKVIEKNDMKMVGIEIAKNFKDGKVYEIPLLWNRWNISSVANVELYPEDFKVTNEMEVYVPII